MNSRRDHPACRALLLAASLLAAACVSAPHEPTVAEIDRLVPIVYPIDTTAPFAYRQWPLIKLYGDCDIGEGVATHGVTMELWSDRARLVVDAAPLAQQLRDGVRQPRLNEWTFDLQQCPAIAELYASGVENHEQPGEPFNSAAVRAEFFINVGPQPLRFNVPGDDLSRYYNWLGRVWRELDTCSRAQNQRTGGMS